jgi:hypothetical protein
MIEKRRSSAEQTGKVFKTQTIEYTQKQGDILRAAFTAKPFAERVVEGIKRVRKLGAESGFSLVSNGQELVYSPIAYGTGHPDEVTERITGSAIQTKVGFGMIDLAMEKMYDLDLENPNLKKLINRYYTLGIFHFHPSTKTWEGFSQHDIEAYEALIENPPRFRKNPDHCEGVFLQKDSKNEIETKLFLIQGPPTNTDYQNYDFGRLNLERQQEILERSGFKTIAVDIPYQKGAVDLAPLQQALQAKGIQKRP